MEQLKKRNISIHSVAWNLSPSQHQNTHSPDVTPLRKLPQSSKQAASFEFLENCVVITGYEDLNKNRWTFCSSILEGMYFFKYFKYFKQLASRGRCQVCSFRNGETGEASTNNESLNILHPPKILSGAFYPNLQSKIKAFPCFLNWTKKPTSSKINKKNFYNLYSFAQNFLGHENIVVSIGNILRLLASHGWIEIS